MLLKYGDFMLPGAFSDKVNLDIDFIDEAVVQCYVPVVKNTFVGVGNLQMITSKFWCGARCIFLNPVLYIVLVS